MKQDRNYPLIFIRIAVWVLMILAAFISASHIVHVFEGIGLTRPYSLTAPLFIDVVAIAGKLSMLPRFDRWPHFQRSGKYMLMTMGAASLAANIGAGTNWGERLYGLLIVGGFMLLENHATKAGKSSELIEAEPVAEVTTAPSRNRKPCKHELAARQDSNYNRRSLANKRKWTADFRADHMCVPSNAPTSPPPAGASKAPVPSLALVEAIATR